MIRLQDGIIRLFRQNRKGETSQTIDKALFFNILYRLIEKKNNMYKFEDNILTIHNDAKISDENFIGRKDIHAVIFEGAAYVGKRAFKGCTGITTVKLAETMLIKDNAFECCIGITKLIIPDTTGIDQNIIGIKASGIAAIGKPYISSFIIAETMNQITTGEQNIAPNLA